MTDDIINMIAEKHATIEDENLRATIDVGISHRVAAAISEALSSQWVDVKEGLPKEKVRYLVASKFWGFVEAELWAGSWYSGADGDRCINDVTHYMLIPEPPKP